MVLTAAARVRLRSLLPVLAVLGLLLPVTLAVPASAATCASPEQLTPGAIDRAFTQQRYLAGLSQPLLSKGRVQVSEKRISWHMTEPFDVETVITPDGIQQSIDGKPASDVAPGAAGFAAALVQSLADLLQGRWAPLEAAFEITRPTTPAGEPWSVQLRPRDAKILALFDGITVGGCTDVSTIEITHPGGDREVITFEATGS